jgi:hypothetical protein
MHKLIPLAKDAIILCAAVQATTGLVLLAKETAETVVEKIRK